MFPYSIVIGILFLVSSYNFIYARNCALVKHKSGEQCLFLFAALFLYCLAAFRYQTGRDWQNYIKYFLVCDRAVVFSGKEVIGFEPGFANLNIIFKKLTNNFYFLQVFIISFSCFSVFTNIYKRSAYPLFTLLLYVLLFYFKTDMAQTRQHIAMAILICGQKFIYEKKLAYWAIVTLAAMSFHISAVVAFPLYFTSRTVVGNKVAVLLLVVEVFITYFGSAVVSLSLSLVGKLPFVPARLSMILLRYVERYDVGRFSSAGLAILMRYVFTILITMIYVFKKEKSENHFFLNFMIATIVNAMGQNFTELFRIANYFFICGNALCTYNLLIDSKSFFKKLGVIRYFVCLMFLVFTFMAFSKDWYQIDFMKRSFHMDYTPYKTFIGK